jgi:hypothetical protein
MLVSFILSKVTFDLKAFIEKEKRRKQRASNSRHKILIESESPSESEPPSRVAKRDQRKKKDKTNKSKKKETKKKKESKRTNDKNGT